MNRTCTACGLVKPIAAFPASQRRGVVYHRPNCSSCHAHDVWVRAIGTRYGLSEDDYEAMLAAQDGRCAICLTPEAHYGRRLAVDHDHKTGAVRGLLCHPCNLGLERWFEDDRKLARTLAYLEVDRP